MNHILTFIFLLFIFYYYWLIGDFVSNIFDLKIKNNSTYIIYGFVCMFFITFCIGVPLQWIQTSWNVFFILFTIIFIGLFISLFINKYHSINSFKETLKDTFTKEKIINHFKDNWVIYVFVFIFALFSVSNVMSLYEFDYDDHYYISKVMNSIGTPKLLNEDFFTGNLTSGINIQRVVNTYEITYAAFASLFNINAVYLCRVTMTIHNYILFGIVTKELGKLISKEKAQYALLPFFLLLINHGFLMENITAFKIRSYDLWQFQNAIWYGSSIVRVLSIPMMLVICIPLIEEKMTFKHIIFIGIFSCSMISFSTIYLPILVVMFFILFILKFSYGTIKSLKDKNKKQLLLNFLGLCVFVFLLFATKKLEHTSLLSEVDYKKFIDSLTPFYNYYLTPDLIMKFSILIIIGTMILTYKSKTGKYLSSVTLLLVLIVIKYRFNELLCLTSFQYSFVILRFYSSIQFMIITLVGISFIKILSLIKFKIVDISTSILSISSVLIFIYLNINTITSINFLGCGINEYGYDFSTIIKQDNMMLDIFNDVAEFFDEKPYDNYTLLSPQSFEYNNRTTYQYGFHILCNRIQLEQDGYINNDNIPYHNILISYWNNEIDYNNAKKAFDYYKGSYFLTFSKEQSIELQNNNYKLEYHNNNCYILKI